MKQAYILFFLLSNFNIIIACRKQAPPTRTAGTLTLVNTLVQGQAIQLSSHRQVVNNNAFAHVGLLPGPRDLYLFPIGDSLKPYYVSLKPLQVQEGDIYTLLLSGLATAPEILLLHEALPVHIDSSMGIRFINLSPGSPAVNITLSTTPALPEFSKLEYQQITPFLSYPITSVFKSYTFQVREAATGERIASLTLSGTNLTTGLPRFKNVTLVLRGIIGGSPAAGITRINHY